MTLSKEDHLKQLAKKRQVRGFQNQDGIYLALDKGFDTLLSASGRDRAEDSLDTYLQTCENGLTSAFGTHKLKGILLKLVQLGKLGKEWDARTQVNRDLIAGPFETENEAMKVAPYVLQERYGWDPEKINCINFYSLCI